MILGAVLALTPLSASPRAQYVQMPLAPETFGQQSRNWKDDIPAHLSAVDGQVTLEREGKLEPAERNVALLSGDRLRTRGGRVEILFADRSTLALDENSELDLLSDSLVRLLDGRLRVVIPRPTSELAYRIDVKPASIVITAAGEYRVETFKNDDGQPSVDLSVFRGSAELSNDFGRTVVRAGRYAVATLGLEPSLSYAMNSAAFDDFDDWANDQRSARIGPVSAAYLPDEVDDYSGAFDNSGSWVNEPTYGQVWYPRVPVAWRPYSQGRWSYTGHFGWTWVGNDSWAWPTHHYGSWGFSTAGWYWIPGSVWAPAWVSWGYAPGYVSWCPIGYYGRPVVGFRADYGYEPWKAWTTVPANRFTHNVWVNEHVVNPQSIPLATRTAFAERKVAPMPTGSAVSRRQIAPLRSPTTTRGAVPRAQPAEAGPFDGAKLGGGSNAAAGTRGPVSSTIIGAPARSTDPSRVQPRDLRGAPSNASQSALPTRAKTAATTVDAPRAAEPQRAEAQNGAPRGNPDRSAPARSIPRSYDAPDSPPPASDPRAPMRARPPEPDYGAPPPSSPSRSRGQSVDRSAPPQSGPPSSPHNAAPRQGPNAPPPSSGPEPSRSRVVQPPPSAAPPSASGNRVAPSPPSGGAPPPSASGNRVAPAPPSAAPPPSKSGGGGTGTATGSGKGRGGR